MNVSLAPPSFWPEPRDPAAWQRALRRLAEIEPIGDPRPCWEKRLRGTLSRRSVPGLYGLRERPKPEVLLGCGLLCHTPDGWALDEAARGLLDSTGSDYEERLARLVVRRSPWVRLALLRLEDGGWQFPRGLEFLGGNGPLLVGRDLIVAAAPTDEMAPDARVLLGDQWNDNIRSVQTRSGAGSLGPLRSPLYLLRAMGWLAPDGKPNLPDDLAGSLGRVSPAIALRQITRELADPAGFVPLEKAVRSLWEALHGSEPLPDVAAWQDRVIGQALDRGTIEVHDWAPGQPRHGRGFLGDRDRKLVRWAIHDDFGADAVTIGNEQIEVAR